MHGFRVCCKEFQVSGAKRFFLKFDLILAVIKQKAYYIYKAPVILNYFTLDPLQLCTKGSQVI